MYYIYCIADAKIGIEPELLDKPADDVLEYSWVHRLVFAALITTEKGGLMAREYNFPVYGTQGGGLVRSVGGKFIFVTKPDCPGLDVGDEMPEMWDYQPANALAEEELHNETQ